MIFFLKNIRYCLENPKTRPRCRWNSNIKLDIRWNVCDYVNLIRIWESGKFFGPHVRKAIGWVTAMCSRNVTGIIYVRDTYLRNTRQNNVIRYLILFHVESWSVLWEYLNAEQHDIDLIKTVNLIYKEKATVTIRI